MISTSKEEVNSIILYILGALHFIFGDVIQLYAHTKRTDLKKNIFLFFVDQNNSFQDSHVWSTIVLHDSIIK